MTRIKTARLSLTVSPSLGSDDQSAADSTSTNERPETSPLPGWNQETEPVQKGTRVNDKPSAGTVTPNARSDSLQSPASPTLTSLPQVPPSPNATSKQSREPSNNSKSFFSNLKTAKSSTKAQQPESTIRRVPQDKPSQEELAKGPVRTKSTPDLRSTTSPEPVPELPGLDSAQHNTTLHTASSKSQLQRRPIADQPGAINVARSNAAGRESPAPASPIPDSHESRKNGRRFGNFMRRNHSSRSEDSNLMTKPPTPTLGRGSEGPFAKPPSRDRSTGRMPSPHNELEETAQERQPRMVLTTQRSQSFRDGAGGALFSGLRHTKARAAEGIGKAHTRLFKQNKSNMTSPSRSVDYSPNYEPKVINLPLIEQTRTTRIARRLEDSKDKTEFWMPALPWRCIDFLNYTGCEVEGLYRVPGSDREVRMWKQRFDQEYDVNLLEEEELYDVNTIGSLFKAWLRELPDEIFPQSIQEELSAAHNAEESAPAALQEALSNLPPWNYYLLFAITCHLSLLNAYSDKNKMSYHNLFVCFAPALKMNGDCFRWLVADWRACWKPGVCHSERAAREAEYHLLDQEDGLVPESQPQQPPPAQSPQPQPSKPALDAQSHSSASTKAAPAPSEPAGRGNAASARSTTPSQEAQKGRPRTAREPRAARASSATSRARSERSPPEDLRGDGGPRPGRSTSKPSTPAAHNRSASQLPELSFGQPISWSPTFPAHQ